MGTNTCVVVCPHCNKEFEMTNAAYNDILQQVRNQTFNKEVESRVRDKLTAALHDKVEPLERKLEIEAREHAAEVKALKAKHDADLEHAVEKATGELEKRLAVAETQRENAVLEVRNELSAEIERLKTEVQFHKDLKLRMSTKMVGETLEQHCQIEFDRIRALAFPNAYFEKDNDARSGTKGDFIFRETDDATQEEILSVMFEMKNEMDATAIKHKNEDFFKKLDADRRQKGCKYAVLVSMLEQDSEYYNQGIVDISHKYPDMYVIRPQFFIPFLTLLYKNAVNAFKYKQEAAALSLRLQAKSNDSQVELDELSKYMTFAANKLGDAAANADDNIQQAVAQIDAVIKKLQKARENLERAGESIEKIKITGESLLVK